MASEPTPRERARALARRATRRRRAQVLACGGVLALCAAGAGTAAQSPRALALCLLGALVAGLMGSAALRRLVVASPSSADALGPPPTLPAASALALLESQLDQAPVALWWLTAGQVAPLNNAARRLVAPGGAADAAQLRAQLQDSAASPRRQVMTFDSERGPERFLLASRTLLVDGTEARLLAQMPIESELEAETLKAWRQLVHVLTHEIMNSLTPIASLSRTAHELLEERRARALLGDDDRSRLLDQTVDDDLAVALEAIARRAESLATFVADYRRVSDWPEPQLAAVELAPLFARLQRLVAADWQLRGGGARFDVQPATLTLMADAGQLEQALLNLLRNATQATATTSAPQLAVTARLVRGGRLAIEVRDNGPGVPHGIEHDIFTPFFTTREHGSGIGLAVVRNLVQGMGGNIRHVKPASGGAAFVLSF